MTSLHLSMRTRNTATKNENEAQYKKKKDDVNYNKNIYTYSELVKIAMFALLQENNHNNMHANNDLI